MCLYMYMFQHGWDISTLKFLSAILSCKLVPDARFVGGSLAELPSGMERHDLRLVAMETAVTEPPNSRVI